MRRSVLVLACVTLALMVGGEAAARCPYCCGDGICEPWESPGTCPQDCKCGNGVCNIGESCSSCPQDCGSCCGNGTADPGEDCFNCPEDLGDPVAQSYDAYCAVGGYDYCVDTGGGTEDTCVNCDPPYDCDNVDPEHCHCGTGVICDPGDGVPIRQSGHDRCEKLVCTG